MLPCLKERKNYMRTHLNMLFFVYYHLFQSSEKSKNLYAINIRSRKIMLPSLNEQKLVCISMGKYKNTENMCGLKLKPPKSTQIGFSGKKAF